MANVSVAELGGPVARQQSLWRYWRGGLQGSEFIWAVAFVVPYIVVFLLFVIYPVCYGVWMGKDPALYAEVFSDPIYLNTVVNTLIFLAFGVNVKLFLALMLSGFFMRPGWWVKALLMIFVLPWAIPALPTFISIHWMLNGEWGLINNALYIMFGIDPGPSWLNSRWLALGSAIASHVWKWTPFWTVILLANLYLVLTLLATIFLLGDFNSIYFVTGGGPANSTHLLATLGVVRDMLDLGKPQLGVAAVMTALPLLIPLVIILMRKLKTSEAQL